MQKAHVPPPGFIELHEQESKLPILIQITRIGLIRQTASDPGSGSTLWVTSFSAVSVKETFQEISGLIEEATL